jgi:hypothetical protein
MSGKPPDLAEPVPWPLPLVFQDERGPGTQNSTRAVPLLREVAWDRDGIWAGDGVEPSSGRPERDVPCQCHKCGVATFVCLWCRRAVPWCFGSDQGDGPEEAIDGLLCDCWCERHGVSPGGQAVAS